MSSRPRRWPQFLFDKSAQVRPCSSQVVEPEESVLSPVLEELRDDVFTPSPSSQPSRAGSTTATAPLTTDTVPSTTDTAPNTDSGAEDRRRQKRAVATSDTSYSQEHRTAGTGPSNYPKRPNRPHTLTSSENHHRGPGDLDPGAVIIRTSTGPASKTNINTRNAISGLASSLSWGWISVVKGKRRTAYECKDTKRRDEYCKE